jgi:hypothetical protein
MPEIPASTITGSIPQVPTFCAPGTSAPDHHADRQGGEQAEQQHPHHREPARALGHQVLEQQEARHQDDHHLRQQVQGLEDQLTGEVAGQPVRHRLVPQQRAVLLLHGEGVGRTHHHAEGDERPEDARQRHRRVQQVGTVDLGVAAQEQVSDREKRSEQVEPLVLAAADALDELDPPAAQAEAHGVLGLHRVTSVNDRAAASAWPASCCCTRDR